MLRFAELFWRAFSPGLLARFGRHKFPEQLHRVGIQGTRNGDKFYEVNAPLAALVFGNERLGLSKLCRQFLLPDARGMSHCDKHRHEPFIFSRFEGLSHAPPGQRIGGKQSDPGTGLSQNWIVIAG
jgi:hypothetical protein